MFPCRCLNLWLMCIRNAPVLVKSNELSSTGSCRAWQLCTLGNSDHALVSVNISFDSISGHGHPIQKTSFWYQHFDWESFPDFLSNDPKNRKCLLSLSQTLSLGFLLGWKPSLTLLCCLRNTRWNRNLLLGSYLFNRYKPQEFLFLSIPTW